MFKKIKRNLLVAVTLLTMAAPVMAPAAVFADNNATFGGLCGGTNLQTTTTTQDCTKTGQNDNLNKLLTNAVNIFSIIVGVVAVIMIIVGGLRYITSGGDSTKVSGAKNTLIYAIIGLIIVALAQLIVHFVLGQAQTLVH
jgi:hypothetical protein